MLTSPITHRPSQDTRLPLVQTLAQCIKEGNAANVSLALQDVGKINSETTQLVISTLMSDAANSPEIAIKQILLQYLLDHTHFGINDCIQDGKRLIDIAAENDDDPFMNLLLENDADPTLLDASKHMHHEISSKIQGLSGMSTLAPTKPPESIAYVPPYRRNSATSSQPIASNASLEAEMTIYKKSLLIDPTAIFNKDTQDFSQIIGIQRSTLGSNGGVFFITGKSGPSLPLNFPSIRLQNFLLTDSPVHLDSIRHKHLLLKGAPMHSKH